MVALTMHVSGADEIEQRYNLLGAHIEDATPAFEALTARFIAVEKETFASEGGSFGHWAPLSAAYAARKAKRWGAQPILQASGHLYRSLTDALDIRIVEPHMMVLGTGDPVGGYHQRGNARLPKRPPLDLSEVELGRWAAVLEAWFVAVDDSVPVSAVAA